MDRSFLSRAEVIAASRKFVCIRLTTYENQEESEFLKSLWVNRAGDLENTVFTLLSPDGKRPLVRPSRSMDHAFADAGQMAETMDRIAGEYGKLRDAGTSVPPLPLVNGVRLAVNVAACDNRPLLVVYAEDDAARKSLIEKVAPLAWSNEFIGRFVCVAAPSAKELGMMNGTVKPGVLVVEPDAYGLKGMVLEQVGAGESAERIAESMRTGLSRHQRREKEFREHVQQGKQAGIFWETLLPVTDPWEKMARERGRERK